MTPALRSHYYRIAQERIDEQIAELRERRADLDVEIQRLERREEVRQEEKRA